MATEEPLREEVDATRGSSRRRKFTCDWNDRKTDTDLPAIGDAYPDAGDSLVVRRIQYDEIPTSDEDEPLCRVTVEYSTPEIGGDATYDTPDYDSDPDVAPTIHESVSSDVEEIDTLGAFELDTTEDIVHSIIKLRYCVLTYSRRVLLGVDKTMELAAYVDSINESEIDVGDNISFSGAAKTLCFSAFDVACEYRRRLSGDYEIVYATTLQFKYRRCAPWDYAWVNAEPYMHRNGYVMVYGDAKPFMHDGTHQYGEVVLRPIEDDGSGNYILDYDKIGWQQLVAKANGITTYAGGHPQKGFQDILNMLG